MGTIKGDIFSNITKGSLEEYKSNERQSYSKTGNQTIGGLA